MSVCVCVREYVSVYINKNGILKRPVARSLNTVLECVAVFVAVAVYIRVCMYIYISHSLYKYHIVRKWTKHIKRYCI